MSNILEVRFEEGQTFATATRLWKGDYGQILLIHGPALPAYYEVHFASTKSDAPQIQVGTPEGVLIPNKFLQTDGYIYAWTFLHTGENDGETKYQIKIPVEDKGIPIDQETPEEKTAVQQAIEALNEQTGVATKAAAFAEESAQRAEEAAASIDKGMIADAVSDYLDDHPITVDETDPTVPEWAKQPTKPKYTATEVGALPESTVIPTNPGDIGAQPAGNYALKTEIPSVPVQSVNGKTGAVNLTAYDVKSRPDSWMPTVQQVGADPVGSAVSAVSQHNTDETAHNDLRIALQGLSDRINAALDSDDSTLDQMSEVVAYIKSNKSLIDAITTSKVSVADIVDNLTTNVSNKPLSAAQGVVIKTLIDALRNDKLDAAELTNAVNTALAQAKASGDFDGVGIQSVEQTTTSTEDSGINVITVTTTDGTSSTFSVRNGSRGSVGPAGADGKDGITPTIGENGNWYLGDTDTGKPSRGAKGDTTVVDAALDGTSKNPVQNKAIYAALAAKAERVNSVDRTVRVEISGAFIYVYFFSGSGYWLRLCFQSRGASGQNYTIMRLNGVRASKDRDFGTYITIVPEGYLEYVFAARIGGSNGSWVGGSAHGYENATKTVISLDSMPLTDDGTYYGRELRLEQTSEIYNPTGGAKIADHYVLNTITADDGWRVAQTVNWVSSVTLSKDTYLCMFALTRNALAKMARNYDYTLYTVPAYGESNATLGAKVDASACVTTGEIDCEVEQLETSGSDCHLVYGDNTYKDHYKVYFRFLTGETEIASGTVFSGKFRVAFNSQLSAVSRNVIHGDEYYTKDETEAKIAELLGVVENGTY